MMARPKQAVGLWAEANEVTVTLDFLTGIGNKMMIGMAVETRARTGRSDQRRRHSATHRHGRP